MGRRNRRRRSPEHRRAVRRWRWRQWVLAPLRLVLLAGLGVGIGFGAWWVAVYLHTSAALAVRCIEVNGNSRSRLQDLLRAADLHQGRNIFSIDLERARRRLEEQPWVRRAQVRRAVPDRLVVEISEHRPAALVNLEGLYLVSPQAEVFKRLQPGERLDLPVITGIDRAALRDEPTRARRQLQEALRLIAAVRGTACLQGRELAEVHLDELMGVSLVLDPGALSVRLGNDAPERRLQTLCRLFDELQRRQLTARAILLDRRSRPGWATVRLQTGAHERATETVERI